MCDINVYFDSGKKKRTRRCIDGKYNGPVCKRYEEEETVDCFIEKCPQNCVLR